MRQKINPQLLLQAQKYGRQLQHPILPQLYQDYYKLIHNLYKGIKKQFHTVCVHGNFPHLMVPHLRDNCKQNLTLVGEIGECEGHTVVRETEKEVFDGEKFDLILSCMEMHKVHNYQDLLKKYLKALKPDGALVGCCWGERTLSDLYLAFLLAENERSGGVSPKVLSFPSVGMFGNTLTTLKYQIPTIMTQELSLTFQSVVDLLTLLQVTGEAGYVRGRRKGTYEDLLLAMSAIYDTQFDTEESTEEMPIKKTMMEIVTFIGWKYNENQPKPLRRGQRSGSMSFIDELKKYDSELQHYRIKEGQDEPTKVEQ